MNNIPTCYTIKVSKTGELLLNTANVEELKKSTSKVDNGDLMVNDKVTIITKDAMSLICQIEQIQVHTFPDNKKDIDGIEYLAQVFIWVEVL